MPHLRPALPFALVLAAAALADGPGTTSALRTEVEARLAAGGLPAARERALLRISADLADDATLADEAASARRAAKRVKRSFRRDAHLKGLLGASADAIGTSADDERASLGAAVPALGATEAALLRGNLEAVVPLFRKAGAARSTASRLAHLAEACRRLDEARAASGAVPVAGAAPRPDFALKDVNRSSESYGRNVTPRSRLGSVSAWYFGHST